MRNWRHRGGRLRLRASCQCVWIIRRKASHVSQGTRFMPSHVPPAASSQGDCPRQAVQRGMKYKSASWLPTQLELVSIPQYWSIVNKLHQTTSRLGSE